MEYPKWNTGQSYNPIFDKRNEMGITRGVFDWLLVVFWVFAITFSLAAWGLFAILVSYM